MQLIMALARKIPQRIAGIDFLNLIPKSAAIKAPVQAPVPGSGMPTKSRIPKNSYFCTFTHGFIFYFLNHRSEKFCFFESVKNLCNK